jgi:hypothetical protein
MEVVLVLVTLGSVLVAAAMALVAWRVSREAEERSAARVAALADEIARDPSAGPHHSGGGAALETRATDGDTVAAAGLFARSGQEPGRARTFSPALVATLILGVVLAGALLASAVGSSGDAAAAAQPQPLELLSLRHELREGTLTVTGLVRNPASGAELDRVTAVVFAFDPNGAFLASGRAPLDFAALAAGEESPFTVSIEGHSGVARYRVSFRRDEGGVVPHVDRRASRSS